MGFNDNYIFTGVCRGAIPERTPALLKTQAAPLRRPLSANLPSLLGGVAVRAGGVCDVAFGREGAAAVKAVIPS